MSADRVEVNMDELADVSGYIGAFYAGDNTILLDGEFSLPDLLKIVEWFAKTSTKEAK